MDPVLPLTDSDDEASQYLRSVQTQRKDLNEKTCNVASIEETSDWFIPQSQLPKNFILSITDSAKSQIISSFEALRQQINQNRHPVEKKRQKALIKRILFEQRPYFSVIQELDHLGVTKVFSVIISNLDHYIDLEEWIFCMLCMLEPPFDLDMYSILNIILKKSLENSDRPSSKVIIVLITEYFKQKLP